MPVLLPRAAIAALVLSTVTLAPAARAETLGEVTTAWKLIGANHRVVVEAYDDPRVGGVTCYVSRARTGGLKGSFGLAEDRAEASIACRQVGPIEVAAPLPKKEEVFSQRMSILFKRLQVVRMVDSKRNVLVYLTYSDKLIDGNPENSVTAVAVDRGQPIPVER
ncbi:MAG: CreA family protein [Rhodocyclaceae bacterium]|nr:CreA family protein [Rhodocyclaceae bacterium]